MTLSPSIPFLTVHPGNIVSIGNFAGDPGDLTLRVAASDPLELFVGQELEFQRRGDDQAYRARIVQISTQRIWLEVDWDSQRTFTRADRMARLEHAIATAD